MAGGTLLGLAGYGDSDEGSDDDEDVQRMDGTKKKDEKGFPPLDDEMMNFMTEIDAINVPSDAPNPDPITKLSLPSQNPSTRPNPTPPPAPPSPMPPPPAQPTLYKSTRTLNLPWTAPIFKTFQPHPRSDALLLNRIERIRSRLDQLPGFPVELCEETMREVERRRWEFEV
ncbi:hypothetical protein HDU67_002350, partial [Dinochytrium kinnereticum]